MTHIQQRLQERNINIHDDALCLIAQKIGNTPSAVILGRIPHQGAAEGAYRSREDSNGDLIVLIVRDARPITVMFRRSNQPLTPSALHVQWVIELQQEGD